MTKTILYLAFYGDNEHHRYSAPSADTKADYIIHALKALGYHIIVLSFCGVNDRQSFFRIYRGYSIRGENCEYIYGTTIGSRFAVFRTLGRFIQRIDLFTKLNRYFNSHMDKVIVYHSLAFKRLIDFLSSKRKKFMLEVEEIYSDVLEKNRNCLLQKEEKMIQKASSYLFSTELLDSRLNPEKKPSIVCNGTYLVESDRKCKSPEDILQSGGRRVIHCVYAGTLDPRKGGAIAAAAAEYLPLNYHLHILGFGSESEKKAMQDAIADIAKRTEAKVTYDGLLTGEDYIRFIQSCDIGLSTQNPDAAFNATSFPSKILSYMANGLRVVSIRIPAIEQSAVGDMLYYYEEQTPEKIAEAILSVDVDAPYDSRGRIQELAERFEQDISKLMESNDIC